MKYLHTRAALYYRIAQSNESPALEFDKQITTLDRNTSKLNTAQDPQRLDTITLRTMDTPGKKLLSLPLCLR